MYDLKNALPEFHLCETGFEGAWPSTASWLSNWHWKARYRDTL